MFKFLLLCSLTLSATASNYFEKTHLFDDLYIGLSTDMVNFGDTLSYDSNTYNATLKNNFMKYQIGHVNLNNDRFIVFYKHGDLDINNAKLQDEDYILSILGISYQWSIKSLSTTKLTPFFALGIGFGSAEVANTPTEYTAVDFDISLGIHYSLLNNIDISSNLYNNSISLISDSDEHITTNSYGLELSLNYHF